MGGLETTGIYSSQIWRLQVQGPEAGRSGIWLTGGFLCPHGVEGAKELSGATFTRVLIPEGVERLRLPNAIAWELALTMDWGRE
jgi:hypothetical protein